MHITMLPLHFVFPFTCWQLMSIHICCATGEQSMYVKPPMDIKIKEVDCAMFNVSWSNNLTEGEVGNYTVKYLYIDDADYDSLPSDEIQLEDAWIERTVFSLAKVKTVLYNDEFIVAESEWIKVNFSAGSATPFLEDIICIIYDDKNLNCTWVISKKAQQDSQYFFSSCIEGRNMTCDHYWKTVHHQHTGCHIQINHEIMDSFYTCVHMLSGQSSDAIQCKWFLPYKITKLNPPENVLSTEKVGLQWDPPSTATANKDCFIYQVNESDLLRKTWKIYDTTSTSYQRSVDMKTEKYSYQVRVKKSLLCRENDIWSDWSAPVFLGDGTDVGNTPMSAYFLLSVTVFLSLCTTALCVRFQVPHKLFYVLLPPIPSPSNKVKSILMLDEFGFQGWMHAPVMKLEEVVTAQEIKDMN